MRTTVTLEPDVEAFIAQAMRERGLSFKEAVNSAIRAGMTGPGDREVSFPTYSMGPPLVDITKAMRLAGELEDEELVARMRRRA
jgi:hypothetical protein